MAIVPLSRGSLGIKFHEWGKPPIPDLTSISKRSTLHQQAKIQNTILEESATPAVKVFTETCLTKLVFETISKKAKGAKKYILPGALCTPRQHMVKAASQTRGQSGGVLVSSDLAARHSSVEMPTATWASTRVVDVVVALTSTFHIRVVGFYGITAKYHKNYVELNDKILSSVLSRILQSTIPCIIMGDFNCCLEDMPLWGRLSDWGWKDAAILNFERTGQEPMMTFKGETRMDYVLIPPQMVHLRFNQRPYPTMPWYHAMVLVPQTLWALLGHPKRAMGQEV